MNGKIQSTSIKIELPKAKKKSKIWSEKKIQKFIFLKYQEEDISPWKIWSKVEIWRFKPKNCRNPAIVRIKFYQKYTHGY